MILMIKIHNIKINVIYDNIEKLQEKVEKTLRTKINPDNIKIIRKSIDAREKPNIYYIYEVLVKVNDEKSILKKCKNNNVEYGEELKYTYTISGTEKLNNRPIIVGAGPAGLFASYFLAKEGYKPLIIERGKKVEERVIDVENFWNTGVLNTNSNVQFGEGGAGTFSDGKLNTNIKDKSNRIKEVLNIFYECGADKSITYLNKPHIGTDVLRKVIINLRNKIIEYGGEFRYSTTLTDIIINNNKVEKIIVNNNEEIDCEVLILALGHSARDTFRMLDKRNIPMESKNFAIGVRVQHNQEMINKSQYGESYKYLDSASYKLTYTTKEKRGVYSFCMCPGGYVVNSSSFDKKLVINGMSNNKRDSKNANSAIIVTVSKKDFGDSLFSGMEFQERLEENAYNLANGNIPIQRYIDFKNNNKTTAFGSVEPVIKGNYELSNIRSIFNDDINNSITEAMEYFGTKIKGFNNDDTLLAAVETRTSSPIRIIRDENGMSSIYGLYPCGEGAGYAGGITSAAVDGIKTFENIIKIYKNC